MTIVLGVNDEKYDPTTHHVISNASCTTNGLAPPVKVLVEEFGLLKGQMTTIHSYTNSQQILDKAGPKDLREARAGAMNIVPTSTGAARALRLVIPEVDGILDGIAYRVPTPTVSVVEVVALVNKKTSKDEVNSVLRHWSSERMKGILDFTDGPGRLDGHEGQRALVDHRRPLDQRRRRRPREGRLLVRQRVGLRLPPRRPDGHGRRARAGRTEPEQPRTGQAAEES